MVPMVFDEPHGLSIAWPEFCCPMFDKAHMCFASSPLAFYAAVMLLIHFLPVRCPSSLASLPLMSGVNI
jgi:hypothetical protein